MYFFPPAPRLPYPEALRPSKWALVTDRLLVLSRRFSDILSEIQEFLWRLLELHILKMVAFTAVWVALEEVPLWFFFSPTDGSDEGGAV